MQPVLKMNYRFHGTLVKSFCKTADNIVNVARELKAEGFDKNGHATGYYNNIFENLLWIILIMISQI